jgi:hypothetical protein
MELQCLDQLVKSGDLKSYKVEEVPEPPGSSMLESDRLTMVLPSGEEIVIDTFASITINYILHLHTNLHGRAIHPHV